MLRLLSTGPFGGPARHGPSPAFEAPIHNQNQKEVARLLKGVGYPQVCSHSHDRAIRKHGVCVLVCVASEKGENSGVGGGDVTYLHQLEMT